MDGETNKKRGKKRDIKDWDDPDVGTAMIQKKKMDEPKTDL